ncbi:hypothetical protein F4778DRAFT_182999 [Xylariomycetidae sp. FL2044]|nr:hypothetical protein F4778DRAFT_182999 [Xylariomycetidae sp. FL2044]
MASHFQIQKPYVLTVLPRPLDPKNGRYVVGEVYGSAPGSRKRKRTELTVGIDGEAINIYNVSSARLVTSYPIPPQSRVQCPILSIRRRIPGTKDVVRYTYAAIEEPPAKKIVLFKDHVDASGKTTSTTSSFSLSPGRPVVFLHTLLTMPGYLAESDEEYEEQLVIVREDGEITCLNTETLQEKWKSSPAMLQQDIAIPDDNSLEVEFCSSSLLSEVNKGIFPDNSEALAYASCIQPATTQGNHNDAQVLIIVSKSGPAGRKTRHVHLMGIVPQGRGGMRSEPGTVPFCVMPMPSATQAAPGEISSSCRLDVRAGTLMELQNQKLITYDLTSSIPKITSTLDIEGASSFMSISKTSLMCSTNTKISVYNPRFRSLQDSADINFETLSAGALETGEASECQLVAYFSKIDLGVAIVNSNLVAIQLEAPAKQGKKRRAEGLLIDSIGRGIQTTRRASANLSTRPSKRSVFSNYLPGSIRGDYWQQWAADEATADAFLAANDIGGLERLLAGKFGVALAEAPPASPNLDENGLVQAQLSWRWPKSRADYPPADRRWIIYAISRAFQWANAFAADSEASQLICQLPQSNIIYYLVDAGHLTLSNVRSAFRANLNEEVRDDTFLAEQLVMRLVQVDPSLELMVGYLSATNLGSAEILIVIRTIMTSFELIQDPQKPPPKLLTDGSTDATTNGPVEADNEDIVMELDDLEDEIQKTVSYLNEDNGVRSSGLSVAFVKLSVCPASSMIKGLRSIYKPEEILSLINLLRVELVRGAWTSRYLDATEYEKDAGIDAPPDGIIKLVADLLGRCVDAIGPGGWLLNHAVLAGDEPGDFVAPLMLEVSAALEGLEEAVYLKGIMGEVLKFCDSSKKSDSEDTTKPIPLQVKGANAEALPLGLKHPTEKVGAHKIVSGGEVLERSQRETGHLISQQVGAYSLERIAI